MKMIANQKENLNKKIKKRKDLKKYI